LNLSPIVAGAWRLGEWDFSPAQRLTWIEGNLDLGISSFDHADIYGHYQAEALFGEALARAPGLRQKLQLVSKCGIKLLSGQRPSHRIKSYDTSAAHIQASVENSLALLHTDRLDLLLIHRPDALMDADEVAEAFRRLRTAGKVLHFGVSNFTPRQFELLNNRFPLVTNQIECSPLCLAPLHDGSLDQAQLLRLRPMIWSPLAGGRLFTGRDETALRVRKVMQRTADQLKVGLDTLAIAWLLRHPSRLVPVIGSHRLEAAAQAMAALRCQLSAEDWYEIWQAGAGHEVP
jgi:predicted oxidoreductase